MLAEGSFLFSSTKEAFLMKRGLLTLNALAIFVVIMSLFGPFVIVQNQAISTYFALFCTNFSIINVFFILGYLFFIGGFVCLLFKDKYETMKLNAGLLFILSGFIFLFSPNLISFALNVDEKEIYIGASALVICILSFVSFIGTNFIKSDKSLFSLYDIVEIAMLISLAVVLDTFIKIPIGITGGSINLAMLPLMIIALRHNFYKSFISCGLVYGLATCLLDGYGLMYLPFDYVLGFGSVAIISIFRQFIFDKNCSKITFKGIVFLTLSLILVFIFFPKIFQFT